MFQLNWLLYCTMDEDAAKEQSEAVANYKPHYFGKHEVFSLNT